MTWGASQQAGHPCSAGGYRRQGSLTTDEADSVDGSIWTDAIDGIAATKESPATEEISADMTVGFRTIAVRVYGPVDATSHCLASGNTGDALRYEVEIDGRRNPVYIGQNPDGATHAIEDVAKAMGFQTNDRKTRVGSPPVKGGF